MPRLDWDRHPGPGSEISNSRAVCVCQTRSDFADARRGGVRSRRFRTQERNPEFITLRVMRWYDPIRPAGGGRQAMVREPTVRRYRPPLLSAGT
jgi:hypothetical protein